MLVIPKVNVAAINELADFLESSKYDFDMSNGSATPQCGSAGCIGGHASVLWPEVSYTTYVLDDDDKEIPATSWHENLLAIKLGISEDEQDKLCYPCMDMDNITREQAVAVLRELAVTGQVRWPELEEPKC